MTQYGPVEWWYANGQLAANQRAAVFGPGNNNTFAPIYADAGMTIPLPNPTTTDALGLLTFYAPDGQYFIFVGPEGSGDSVEVILGAAPGAVDSVNGQTGNVVLDAADVGAQPIATINAKGDLYAGTGNDATTRRAVGADGEVLTADSSDPTGLSWSPAAGGAVDSVNGQTGVVVLDATDVGADVAGAAAAAAAASQPIATINAKGDLYAGTANDTTTRLPVGADGRVLTADSVQPTGLAWSPVPSSPVTSVNGFTGVVVLGASDVGADPAGSAAAAAAASQPLATIDAKGDLYAGTANNTTARRPVGTDGQVLTADSAQATGLNWTTPTPAPVTSVNGFTGVVVLGASDVGADPVGSAAAAAAASQPLATIDAKGDLYAGTADNATARRGVGTDGQVLTADSTQATGLNWTTPAAAPVTSVNGFTGVVVLGASDVGAQPIATINAKGDLYVGTGNDATTRRAVGTDGQVLTADSAQSDGVKWAAASVDAGAQQRSTLTTKGDLYVATASATTTRQGVGTNGYTLIADSAQTNGVKWATEKSFSFMPRSTGYISANGVTTARSSKAATQNTMFLLPFMLLVDATTSTISFEITGNVANAVVRLGFYALDPVTLLPTGAAVVDFGTTTADTTSTKTFAAVQALTAGGWALAFAAQTAAPTIRHCAGFNPLVASVTFPAGTGLGWNNGWAQTGVSGGLPTIGTIADTDTPMCGIKF